MTSQSDSVRRKRLGEMLPEERRMWAETTHARLSAFSAYVQRYLDRRQDKNWQTRTDDQYSQFQVLAADILAALEEIQEEATQEEEGTR